MLTREPTPKVDGRYGAPLGRTSDHLAGLIVTAADSPFTLRRIRLDSGGYDSGGAYWGFGAPLYWWAVEIVEGDTRDQCSGYLRAANRLAAKNAIRSAQPAARFYR